MNFINRLKHKWGYDRVGMLKLLGHLLVVSIGNIIVGIVGTLAFGLVLVVGVIVFTLLSLLFGWVSMVNYLLGSEDETITKQSIISGLLAVFVGFIALAEVLVQLDPLIIANVLPLLYMLGINVAYPLSKLIVEVAKSVYLNSSEQLSQNKKTSLVTSKDEEISKKRLVDGTDQEDYDDYESGNEIYYDQHM